MIMCAHTHTPPFSIPTEQTMPLLFLLCSEQTQRKEKQEFCFMANISFSSNQLYFMNFKARFLPY